LLVANDRCEGRESHRTSEVLDVHLTPPSTKRKSAGTHSNNDAAGGRPRGADKLVLLFPVLPRFVECGLTVCAFFCANAQRAFSFSVLPNSLRYRRSKTSLGAAFFAGHEIVFYSENFSIKETENA
jgi:hypothetical protein